MPRWPARLGSLTLALTLFAVSACRVTDLRLWGPIPSTAEVEQVQGIAYHDGPTADEHRHRLDLFLPKGRKDFPVVVLVHGGAWTIGDNRCCGLYSSVGSFLASQGIAAILPNYRLSPSFKHPEHAKDVARAVAWTRQHIEEYGGRPDRLFLVGHSAGGHLVSLLSTDDRYLRAEGMSLEDIRGVVSISGVYRIPPGKVEVSLGGPTPSAVHLDEVVPLRETGGGLVQRNTLLGLPLSVDVYGPAFGDDPQTRADASPVGHVRPGLPPFLLVNAENDLPTLTEMAEDFRRALEGQGCEVRSLVVPARNHNSVLFSAIRADDPVAAAISEFIRRCIAPGTSGWKA